MFIHSVKLQNIRSYIDETVSFPDGSTLLIGDIGSGKSTILLAIEFALFGTRRTVLDAKSLLRNGKNTGSVTLETTIQDKKIIITRNLKRGKFSISQESGTIEIDGHKEEGTAIELKSKILQLIGYPEELVTKSKSLIFRYTVFTPQEEMKKILFDNPEERINTLRKLFNIDKYKRVKENCQLLMRELRTNKRAIGMQTEDLEELKTKKMDMVKAQTGFEENLVKTTPLLEAVNKQLAEKLEKLSKLEKVLRENNQLRQQQKINEQKQIYSNTTLEKNKKELENISKLITELKDKIVDKVLDVELPEYKTKLTLAIQTNDQKKLELIKKTSKYENDKEKAQDLINSITELTTCPTCLQSVTDNHKQGITEDQKKIISKSLEGFQEFSKELHSITVKLDKMKTDEEKITIRIRENELIKRQIDDKLNQQEKLKNENIKLDAEIEKIKLENQKLSRIVKIENDTAITDFQKEIEIIRKDQREKEIIINDMKKEVQLLKRQIIDVVQLIQKKEEVKKQIEKLSTYTHWMEEYFIKAIDLIEKQVFVSIHRDFDETFRTWFQAIIDDETIDVRLDESFSPVIEQNGYEQFVENLSGGEKTTVALAYRLALNKVVNDFVGTVKTRDIIILDEPTDGFSSEQLDRMREVLDKLNMKQTIIVSHEQKMESYVQNVLRVVKRDHVSRVSS